MCPVSGALFLVLSVVFLLFSCYFFDFSLSLYFFFFFFWLFHFVFLFFLWWLIASRFCGCPPLLFCQGIPLVVVLWCGGLLWWHVGNWTLEVVACGLSCFCSFSCSSSLGRARLSATPLPVLGLLWLRKDVNQTKLYWLILYKRYCFFSGLLLDGGLRSEVYLLFDGKRKNFL